MKQWKSWAVVSLAAASLMLAGCGEEAQTSEAGGEPGKMKVVTTFYPMYEFSKQIAGDHADVEVLVPAGTEPHDWEPTAKDIAEINKANVFVYNGAGFEAWVDEVLHGVKADSVKVVEATKGVELMEGGDAHEGHGHEHEQKHEGEVLDPHIWLDPVLVQQEVKNIADALIAADPAHAEDYKKNRDAYLGKLQELHKEYEAALSNVKSKELVTSHTAFAYLAKRYGLMQEPIGGLSPEQEPSAAEMKDIIQFAKEHDVKTIFFETLASPKVAEAVAREIGAKTAVLNPLEGLTEEEKAQGLDYISVMKKNLEELKKALSE